MCYVYLMFMFNIFIDKEPSHHLVPQFVFAEHPENRR